MVGFLLSTSQVETRVLHAEFYSSRGRDKHLFGEYKIIHTNIPHNKLSDHLESISLSTFAFGI